MKKKVSFIVLAALSKTLCATTYFVSPLGAGTMNGTSWQNAFPQQSLQTAINMAAGGDEVWVAAGTYYTTSGTNRTVSFSMKNNVAIYGSFTGTETALTQRNFSSGISSILSGEIASAAISDNSLHVISNSALNTTAILDGFYITGGNSDGNPSTLDACGGGMLNIGGLGSTCSPTIRHCVFAHNNSVYGAGIFNHGFTNGNASPHILNCVFVSNAATAAGAIDNYGYSGNASPFIGNCLFTNNSALLTGGAIHCWGGGNGNASPTITNCTFAGNSAGTGGGAIVVDNSNTGSGFSGTSTVTLQNSILWNNNAPTGPEFYIIGSAELQASWSAVDLSNQSTPHVLSLPATGCITSSPDFVNAGDSDGSDDVFMTADDGFVLQNNSPGQDAGNNSLAASIATDLKFETRLVNATIDMGAYETIITNGTNIKQQSTHVSAFPIPSAGKITFEIGAGIQSVCLYNVSGNYIKHWDINNQTQFVMDISDMPDGCYFVELRNSAQTITQKIIKQGN